MRKSNLELPPAKELTDILAAESQRKAAKFDYLDKHPEIFAPYNKLAELAGASTDWIHTYKTLGLNSLSTQIQEASMKLAEYIGENRQQTELYDQLYDAMSPSTEPAKADAIFVFGSSANVRIEKAVELYKQGFAPKIIVSGRRPHYEEEAQAEADRMAAYAVEQGAPADVIIKEPYSITLPDNVKRCLYMFDQMDWHPTKLIIIATSYVMRRALMEWYKFPTYGITVTPVSAMAATDALKLGKWFTTEAGIKMLLNEYAKMVIEHKMDLIREESD